MLGPKPFMKEIGKQSLKTKQRVKGKIPLLHTTQLLQWQLRSPEQMKSHKINQIHGQLSHFQKLFSKESTRHSDIISGILEKLI